MGLDKIIPEDRIKAYEAVKVKHLKNLLQRIENLNYRDTE